MARLETLAAHISPHINHISPLQINFSCRPCDVGTPMVLVDRILHVEIVLKELIVSFAFEVLVSALQLLRIEG
jgi:hypothetical protein